MGTKQRNKSGQEMEDYLAQILTESGYTFMPQAEVGQTLFCKKMITDFLVCFDQYDIIIECKRQEVRGSAEEKIFYTAHSLLNVCHLRSRLKPTYPVLVLYGAGWTTGCAEYMREFCRHKPIAFRSLNGLIKDIKGGTFQDEVRRKCESSRPLS